MSMGCKLRLKGSFIMPLLWRNQRTNLNLAQAADVSPLGPLVCGGASRAEPSRAEPGRPAASLAGPPLPPPGPAGLGAASGAAESSRVYGAGASCCARLPAHATVLWPPPPPIGRPAR